LRRFWRVFDWLVTVEISMITFGAITAPLLLACVTDIAVAIVLIRNCTEMRIALLASVRSDRLSQGEVDVAEPLRAHDQWGRDQL